MMGPLMMFPNEDVERESLRGLPDLLFAAFFFLMKMIARMTATIRTTAPAAAPPAIPAIGGPVDSEGEAEFVLSLSADLVPVGVVSVLVPVAVGFEVAALVGPGLPVDDTPD